MQRPDYPELWVSAGKSCADNKLSCRSYFILLMFRRFGTMPMLERQSKLLSFFLSPSESCSYLPGRVERKMFTVANRADISAVYNSLAKQGFRRSGCSLYKPACAHCSACLSVRINVRDFKPSTSQKRILRKNSGLKRKIVPAVADEQQFKLFRKYLNARHCGGSMSKMTADDYAAWVDESLPRTRLVLYFEDNSSLPRKDQLAACCITDFLDDSASMVYSFFDPDRAAVSLGTFMILDHVRIATLCLPKLNYVNLGYWIPTSRRMAYKSQFSALEILHNSEWIPIGNPADYTPDYFPPLANRP